MNGSRQIRLGCRFIVVLAVASVVLTGCGERSLTRADVSRRTGIKLPVGARLREAIVQAGYDPGTFVKAELPAGTVKTFLAGLPAGSRIRGSGNRWGGFDGAPGWWDAAGVGKCVFFRVPDAGSGAAEGLVSLDDPRHPMLYIYSNRGM